MAARYNLQPNEVMILKGEGVMHGGGFGSSYTDELILTNLNLVLLKKGMFGIAMPIQEVHLKRVHASRRLADCRLGPPVVDLDLIDRKCKDASVTLSRKQVRR